MKLWAFARSKRVLQCVSMAVLLCLSASVVAPPAARAEEEKSLFSQLNRKKKSAAPATTGHTQGSGLPATTETQVLNDGSAAPFITPDSAAQMQAMADKYAKIVADGGWPQVPRGRIKKGAKGKQAAILNQRLYIEGYLRVEATQGEFQQLFTSATEEALKRFQINHGLSPSGVIDAATLQSLNVTAQQRLATIQANIPRLAEYAKDLGPRYIVVNVPAQQIESVSDGKVYSIHNAIVGRPSRPTPVVMTPLTIVRFNPYWNAPPSIVERDILPRMKSRGASRVMAEMNMKVFQGVGGPEVNPDKINWRTAKITDYYFRQEPGGDNAMATAKVEFNSPFGIYLHDTPEPHLFKTGGRFYSSGCVRVEKVAILLDWILQNQDGLDQARIAQLAETKERLDVNIANAPQLRVAYLTSWPAKDGVAAFRSDIYDLDGSGFVVGQPLPVGESLNGKRFVLKPIPYFQEDIDVDGGGLFTSLFRGKSAENEPVRPGQNKKVSDSLIKLNGKPAANAKQATAKQANAKKTASKKATGPATTKKFLFAGKDDLAGPRTASATTDSKSKKKPVQKKKTTTAAKKDATKPVKVAKADAKAADTKTKTAATTAKATTPAKKPDASATAAAAPKAAPKPAAPAAKPATNCKPGANGKLPAGCPAPAAASTPAPKPPAAGKTANAAN